MSAIAMADVLCTIGFGTALLFVALVPVAPSRRYMRPIKVFMMVAMSLYLFVGVSNVLEWGGVTGALDVYEDYAEVLFIPLMAYLVFSISMAQQLENTARTEELVRGEQELLTSIVEASPAGIMVVTNDGGVTFANDRARDTLGLHPGSGESRYRAPDDVRLGPEPGGVIGLTEGLRSLVAQGRVDDVVRYAEHPGGRIVALDVSARPLVEGGSPHAGSVIAFVDMTERLRYREDLERAVAVRTRELIEANRQLAVANDAKRDFLARLSHELRTPLSSIIGFTGTMLLGKAGKLSGEQKRQLEMVQASGSRLLDLVNGVVDIALIETGRESIVAHQVDACEVARAVADLVRPFAADRDIDLEVDCPDGALMLMTDAGKLSQIVRSFAINAIRHSDEGGWVRLVVRGDADSVNVSVADSGAGIPGKGLAHTLQGFGDLANAATAPGGGTGMGLAICRDLAVLLGGDIEVESAVGTGSTFTVTLPRAIPDPGAPAPRQEPASGE